jgi:predicted DNA-binding transcriptional regulator AlpA
MAGATQDPLLTERETATMLADVSPKTLRNWRYLRQGPPFVKVGGMVRYDRREVERWLVRRTVQTSDRAAG